MLIHLGSFITFIPPTSVLDPRWTNRTLQVGFCQTYGFFNQTPRFFTKNYRLPTNKSFILNPWFLFDRLPRQIMVAADVHHATRKKAHME